MAAITVKLGRIHLDGGAFAEAEACFREEVSLRERLVAAQPGQRLRLIDLAWAQVNLATALLRRAPAAGPPAAADLAAAREVFRAIDLRPIDVPPSDEDVVELPRGLSHAGRPARDGLIERLRSEVRLRSRSAVAFDSGVVHSPSRLRSRSPVELDSGVVLSGAELAQVMIHVQVGPAQPRPLRHPAEDRMPRPRRAAASRGGSGRAAPRASRRRRRTRRAASPRSADRSPAASGCPAARAAARRARST